MRDENAQEPAEEEFSEFSYLLSLPADTSANEKSDYQDDVTSSSRRNNIAKASPVKHVRCEARFRELPVSAGACGHLRSMKRPEGKDTSSSVNTQSDGARRLQLELQQPLKRQSPRLPPQPWQQQRQDRPVQLQQHEQKPDPRREPSQQQRERQQLQLNAARFPTVSHNSTECSLQKCPPISSRGCPTAAAAAAVQLQRHRTPANHLAALQRRRQEAAAAATAASKNRLEAYKQRRRLAAAKHEAAQQEEIEKSRLEFLECLRKHQAEEEQWRQHQQKESMLFLQLQQELHQRQAERTKELKLRQAARAAAALKTLAAERVARAAAAEDSERRRNCVRRMEQVRAAAQRAKAAAALRRMRCPQGNSQPQRARESSTSTMSAPALASTAARDTNKQHSGCTTKGEKPRLLSSSTARRVALRQQKYSTSFLHRLMVNGVADGLLPESSASTAGLERSPPLTGASCFAPRLHSSSASSPHDDRSSSGSHADAQSSSPAPSFGATASLFTAPTTPNASLVGLPCSPVERTSSGPMGEDASESKDSSYAAPQRPAMQSQESFAAPLRSATSGGAVTRYPTPAAEPHREAASAASTAPAVKTASANTDGGVEWSPTPDPSVADTHNLVEWCKQAAGLQSSRYRHREEGGICNFGKTSCFAVSAATSTAATTPRAAPNAAVKTFGDFVFTAEDVTHPRSRENGTAEQASPPGKPLRVITSKQTSLSNLSEAGTACEGYPPACGRAGDHLYIKPGTCEFLFANLGVSARQQEDLSLPVALYSESGAVMEPFAGWPQKVSQAAPPLPPVHVPTEAPFAAEGAKQHGNSASSNDCRKVTDRGYCEFNVKCEDICGGAGIVHNGSNNVCSTPYRSSTCSTVNVATWTPTVGENGDSTFRLADDLVAAARWGDASSMKATSEKDLIIHSTEGKRHALAETDGNGNTSVNAARVWTPEDDKRTGISPSVRLSRTDISLAQPGRWEASSSDDYRNSRYPVEHANVQKSLLFKLPSTPSLSAPGAETGPPAARRAIPLAASLDTLCYSSSPFASPRVCRSHGTPNFGLRLTNGCVDFPEADAKTVPGTSGKWRMTDTSANSEPTTGHCGCSPATEARARHQWQWQEQQVEQMPQQHRQEDKNDFHQEAPGESTEGVQEPLRSVRGGRVTAAEGALNSQGIHSDLAYSFVNGPPRSCGAVAGLPEAFHRKCPGKIHLDFSERVRVQQRGRTQQSKEDLNMPLLQLQSFSNQLSSLCSSSSSGDLNNSNGSCCCEAVRTYEALHGQRHAFRKCRGLNTAGDRLVVVPCGETAKPNVTVTAAPAEYVPSDDAAAAAVTSSPNFAPCPKSTTNCLWNSDARGLQCQQRWQRHLRVLAVVREAAGEQTSDGAEADAESNFSSADEAEACRYPYVKKKDDGTEYQHGPRNLSSSRTEKSSGCRNSNDADHRALSARRNTEGRLPNTAALRAASVSSRAPQRTDDNGAATTQACAASAAVDRSFHLPTKDDPSRAALVAEQGSCRVLGYADKIAQNGTTALQDQAPTTASDGASKAKTHNAEGVHQHQVETRLEWHSNFSERNRQEKEPAGNDWKANSLVSELHVLSVHERLLPVKGNPQVKHSQQQRSHLPTSTGERELCSNRDVQQLPGNQRTRATAATFLEERVCQGPIASGESAVAALVDEFLGV